MKRNDQAKQKKIAKERIDILFQKAEETFSKHKERANRYIQIARRIAMKLNIRLSKEQKRSICKHCYSYLVSGNNAIIRIRNGNIITYCKECKKYSRIPLSKKNKKGLKILEEFTNDSKEKIKFPKKIDWKEKYYSQLKKKQKSL